MEYPDDNPKTTQGTRKPGIHAVPPVAIIQCGQGMADGEVKYGLMNYRERRVSSTIYYDAAMRHLMCWWDGEDKAPDSGVHHLGHVMACCAILLDAESQGTLNDNRPSSGTVMDLIKRMTAPEPEPEPETKTVEVATYLEMSERGFEKSLVALASGDSVSPVDMVVPDPHVTLDEVMATVELFLCTEDGADRWAELSDMRKHVGSLLGDDGAPNRCRMAYYLDCRMAGSKVSLRFMDDRLSRLVGGEQE